MRAHRSFVLGIGLIFLLLRHLRLAALGEASLVALARNKGGDRRGTGESLLAKDGLGSVRMHRERCRFEGLCSGHERISHE